MTSNKKCNIIAMSLALFIWNWGALNADTELSNDSASYYVKPDMHEYICGRYRFDLSMTALFALLPPMWIASPFVTGFYEYGWRLAPHPLCGRQ